MKYEQIVQKLSNEAIKIIVHELNLKGDRNELLIAMTTSEQVSRIWEQFKENERSCIKQIILSFGSSAFTIHELEKVHKPQWDASLRLAMVRLRRKSIVIAMKKTWGDLLFAIPEDVYPLWLCLSTKMKSFSLFTLKEKPLEVQLIEQARLGLATDLLCLTAELENQPVILTKKGAMDKRSILRLTGRFQPPKLDHQLGQLVYKQIGKGVYPPLLAFYIDMAMRLDIIVLRDGMMQVNQPELSLWLDLNPGHRSKSLYRLFRSIYALSPAWMQHAVIWLETQVREEWTPVRLVLEWLNDEGCLPYEGEEWTIQSIHTQWLIPLTALGWMETGESGNGLLCCRWTPEPTVEKRVLMIQPDLDIWTPPTVSLRVRWELEKMTKLEILDTFSTYKLNAETVARAIKSGLTSEQIIHFLSEHAVNELPAHFKQMIIEWSNDWGRVEIHEAILIRIRDDKTAKLLREHPEISVHIHEMITDRIFLLYKGSVESVNRVLNMMGIHPLHCISNDSTKQNEVQIPGYESSTKAHGLFRVEQDTLLMMIDSQLPQVEEIYPRIDEVPSMWINDYRNYHHSTRKNMIRQAIEWRVSLKYREGKQEMIVQPKELGRHENDWKVVVIEENKEIILNLEQWEEIQLILPGINE